jgi:hypothetical protein
LNFENLQQNGNRNLGLTDSEFTAKLNSGEYTRDTFIHDGYGYSLAQWTYHSRKASFYDFMKARGKGFADPMGVLAFMMKELKGYKAVWKVLTTTDSVREASDIVLTQYERPADQGEKVQLKRAGYGQKYFDKYAGNKREDKPEVIEKGVPSCVTEMAKLVIAGRYGNGTARKENIYKEVQNEVNRLCRK